MARSIESTDSAAVDRTADAHALADKLRAAGRYGPYRVITFEPDIPGVQYAAESCSGRQFASIGHMALRLVAETDGMPVPELQVVHQGREHTLRLEQVDRVEVDHPLSELMPLDGHVLPAVGVSRHARGVVLHSISPEADTGWRDRIGTGWAPGYAGIGVVKAYPADDPDIPTEDRLPTAGLHIGARDPQRPKTFLISRLGNQTYLVTACTGCTADDMSVKAPPPRQYGSLLRVDVNICDKQAGSTYDELLASHLHRHDVLTHGDIDSLAYRLEPYVTDSVYLHAAGYGNT